MDGCCHGKNPTIYIPYRNTKVVTTLVQPCNKVVKGGGGGGRIKGYAYGAVDGFHSAEHGNEYIHQAYVTGVSLTVGSPMKHIWTFAAGLAELGRLSEFPDEVL